MRRRFLVVVAAVALAVFGRVVPAHADAEGSFVAEMNAARATQGLAPVQVYWDLVDDARAHSQRMMDGGNIYHNPDLASVCSAWQALGENVGVGGSVSSLHQAFLASPAHRGNILGDYNYVGVGVVQESADKMWVTVVFMRGPDGLIGGGAASPTTTTVEATTTTTVAPPTTTTVAPTTTTTVMAPPSPETTTTTLAVTAPSAAPEAAVAEPQPEAVGVPGLLHPIME